MTIEVSGLTEASLSSAAGNTDAIQDALDLAATAGVTRPPLATGGGGSGAEIVRLPPGRFYVSRSQVAGLADRCIAPGNATILEGSGHGTELILADGVASTADPCTVLRVKNATNFVQIRQLRINGNKANQADTGQASHGIDLNRGGIAELYDGMLVVENVLVFGCAGSGVKAAGAAVTARVAGCWVYHCDGNGVWLQTDSSCVDTVCGNNARNGFLWLNGISGRGVGLKAFGSGGADFGVSGCTDLDFAACQSEDYKGSAGWFISGSSHINLAATRVTRRHHDNPDGTNAAYWVENDGPNRCHHVTIQGDVHGVPDWEPAYALLTRDLGDACEIRLKVDGVYYGNHNDIGSVNSPSSVLAFNNVAQVHDGAGWRPAGLYA